MDLTTLRLIRRPQTPCNDPHRNCLVLGTFLAELKEIPDNNDEFMQSLNTWLRQEEAYDPLFWKDQKKGKEQDREAIYALIGKLDRWLCRTGDMPSADKFIAFRKRCIEQSSDQCHDEILSTSASNIDRMIFTQARTYLCDWIEVETLLQSDLNRLRGLTRMLLLLDLLDESLVMLGNMPSKETKVLIWDMLHRRPVVLRDFFASQIQGPGIQLIREATVSDLFVVRNAWSCYQPGEIATIMNVFAGESFEQSTTRLQEEETITTNETETIQSTEKTQEDKSQSEISREIDRASSLQVNAEGMVNVSGQFGFTKYAASAQVGVSASLSESTRQANKIAREMVSKAVSKVESRVREERILRRLNRVEDITKHAINNPDDQHRTGIYRWVDRIDRYQVFQYPDRLQLEFQIPEPATYVRWRLKNPSTTDNTKIPEPPAFSVKSTDILEGTYANLALKYRASNLPALPTRNISLSHVLSGNTDQKPLDGRTETWEIPKIEKTGIQEIPSGYNAKSVKFAGMASPFRANWRTELYRNAAGTDGDLDDQTYMEGFHYINVGILVGGTKDVQGKGGNIGSNYSVQLDTNDLGYDNRSNQRYADSFLSFTNTGTGINLTPPVTSKLSLGAQSAGASSLTVSFLIECERTDTAFMEWQNNVYDVLFDAWRAWDQAWRTQALQSSADDLLGLNATSPSRNRETVVEELKRQVISWLLDAADFAGYDALEVPAVGAWPRMNISTARNTAANIQFLEQAFEWGNLSYIFYPYYWASDQRWDDLADLQGADPDFVRFLRSGSARVIVPARPTFENAVNNWLLYKEPFMGDPLPIPGDKMYVSIAQEIRDLTGPPSDGQAGDSWETRLGTSLVWLDPSPKLPKNTSLRLGMAPYEPKDPICKTEEEN